MSKYVAQEIPVRFNIFLPTLVFGVVHYVRVCRSLNKLPYLVIYSISIVTFLSLISHKEPKFLLPIFPPCFIIIGQYLQYSLSKTRPGLLKAYVLQGVLIELYISIWFVHFHEIGAWGPMNHIQKYYPDYESVVVANKFEGNYLSLNH